MNSPRESPNSKHTPDSIAEGLPHNQEDTAAARGRRKSSPVKRAAELPRHRAIYEVLLSEIQSGVYKPGERLPSEALLCERFQASRITVAKAFQSLQRDKLVNRRAGSGTYVEKPAKGISLQFGILIPNLDATEFFEAICQGILRSPGAQSHSLTWGSFTSGASDTIESAEQLCQQYIAQGVAGVFFAPAEYSKETDDSNHRLASMLERAKIPIVLLDRDFKHYPDRSNFDIVGIDNHRAGYLLTQHLFDAGARRIVFATLRGLLATGESRAAGYRHALAKLTPEFPPSFFNANCDDPAEVTRMLKLERPDGIVCANDVTAARLMRTLVSLGARIPDDIRMAGIDDVLYARFLPTPLTTLRQNCAEIGAVAMSTMLDRISHPNYPVRDILVRCDLTIRASSGFVSTEATQA